MAEPISEQIALALVAAFGGISGDEGTTYWYTPSAVLRAPFFPAEFALPDSRDVVYVLRPGDEDVTEEYTHQGGQSAHEFFLIVAKQHRRGTDDPLKEAAPIRLTVVNRLVADAVRRMLADVTLDGIAVNVNADSISVNRDQYLPNWALAELRFSVTYTFTGGVL